MAVCLFPAGLIFVANTIVKAQEDDEGENKYASVWWCLPLGEAPCGSEECEGGFSETFDRTVSCNELQSTRPIYHAGFNADGLVMDPHTNHVIFTAWPSNVQVGRLVSSCKKRRLLVGCLGLFWAAQTAHRNHRFPPHTGRFVVGVMLWVRGSFPISDGSIVVF